jgi:hypothetical protein
LTGRVNPIVSFGCLSDTSPEFAGSGLSVSPSDYPRVLIVESMFDVHFNQ